MVELSHCKWSHLFEVIKFSASDIVITCSFSILHTIEALQSALKPIKSVRFIWILCCHQLKHFFNEFALDWYEEWSKYGAQASFLAIRIELSPKLV